MSRTTTIPAIGSKTLNIALVGNPNAGKSSLFNHLTGLNQKVGNYPGVTVDKKVGRCVLGTRSLASVVDLPGTYSVFPRSSDEQVVLDHLLGNPPDAVVAVIDMTNLERGLLLATQLIDLALPVVLVLNMADVAQRQGLEVNTVALGQRLGGVPVVVMNARRGEGIDDLKEVLRHRVTPARQRFFDARPLAPDAIETVRNHFDQAEDYAAYLLLQQGHGLRFLLPDEQQQLARIRSEHPINPAQLQIRETTERYRLIRELLHDTLTLPSEARISLTDRIDRLVTHRVGGYLIFFGLLFLIFQAIFAWATVPMDFIDYLFSELSGWIKDTAPAGALTDLLAEGIVPGIGGGGDFHSADCHSVRLHCPARRVGLHGAGGVSDGQADAQGGAERAQRGASHFGAGLRHSGHHGHPQHRPLERPPDHHLRHSVDELLGPPAGLYHPDCPGGTQRTGGGLYQPTGLGPDGHVFARLCGGYFIGGGDEIRDSGQGPGVSDHGNCPNTAGRAGAMWASPWCRSRAPLCGKPGG